MILAGTGCRLPPKICTNEAVETPCQRQLVLAAAFFLSRFLFCFLWSSFFLCRFFLGSFFSRFFLGCFLGGFFWGGFFRSSLFCCFLRCWFFSGWFLGRRRAASAARHCRRWW